VPSKNSNSVVMASPFVWGVGAPVVEGHTSTEENAGKSSHRTGEMCCGAGGFKSPACSTPCPQRLLVALVVHRRLPAQETIEPSSPLDLDHTRR
jgi:hypothetical protein